MGSEKYVDFFNNINIEPLLTFSLDILVILSILLLLFHLPRNTKKIQGVFTPRNSTEGIDIVVNVKETINNKMPVTVNDVKWYLQEVNKVYPSALNGIQKIYLCNRPLEYHPNIMGSYTPNGPEGKTIRLYTASYVPLRELFTLDFSSIGEVKYGYSETQMRKMILFTLGHELGHNVFYDKTGRLFGDDVEEFCDRFSENLNIVKDPQNEGLKFHIKDPVDEYMN